MSSKVSMEHQVENGETAMEQEKTLYVTFMQESNELREKKAFCAYFLFLLCVVHGTELQDFFIHVNTVC